MGVPARRRGGRPGADRWETIRYAIDSTPRTVRLCTILLVASVPPSLIIVLLHH